MQARLKQSSRLLLLRVSLACKSRACPLLCAEEGVPVRRIQGPTSAFFLVLVVAIACPCKHKILCLQGHAMATTSTRKKALVGPCMRLTGTPSSAHSKGHARDLQARDTRSSSSLEDCFSLACTAAPSLVDVVFVIC